MNNIETLLERLESLQIMEKASSDYEQMNTEMSAVLAPAPAASNENIQAGMPKNMVPDLGWCQDGKK